MFGILNINKPPGRTSRDVVNHVQRLIRPVKVGHAGTLDPMATGVLVLCLGPATRLIQYVQQLPKQYRGSFLLGRRSDSDDLECEVFELEDAVVPTIEDIREALPQFAGTIQQRPPAFSAIKVKGKRAYTLARAGVDVQLESRPVTIHELQLVRYEYPELVLDITCGSGTYIRSLGRDLGESLGTAAVMSSLVRTAIGEFSIESAVEIKDISVESISEHLLPAEAAVQKLNSLCLTDEEVHQLSHGLSIRRPNHGHVGELAAFDSSGQLIAIVGPRDLDQIRPLSNLAVAKEALEKEHATKRKI